MDANLIVALVGMPLTAAATVLATVKLVSGSIGSVRDEVGSVRDEVGSVRDEVGSVRRELSEKMDAHAETNRKAHDAIGLRIDAQGARVDALRTELGGRIDKVVDKLAKTSEDVAFIKGQLVATGQVSAQSDD